MALGFLNIGTQEMVLIVIVILLLFGGKKLPELARGLGKGIREFKDASEGIKREISDQINNFEKDLDVTDVDKPQVEKQDQNHTPSEQEVQPIEEEPVLSQKEEEKKPLPQFTKPENTYQHNPGQQSSDSDEEHYKQGYNDHFASNNSGDAQHSGNDDATKKV
ncbi:Sec-independent protein translocase subunit TatA/TatB [Sphingobacterium sp. LRF_L2]|uniref:Sec-independent protein translocase subunit TatA/TatB n=1 Tax=Sphingobacterium sp. LRF_L2 TaxID=3369421 RepID=UPI003F5EB4FA